MTATSSPVPKIYKLSIACFRDPIVWRIFFNFHCFAMFRRSVNIAKLLKMQ